MLAMHAEVEATMSAEEREQNKKVLADIMATEESKAAAGAEATATFQAADTDGDGLLNFAEFKDFASKTRANWVAKGGVGPEPTEKNMETSYAIHNSATPETEGISLADYFANVGQYMKARAEAGH